MQRSESDVPDAAESDVSTGATENKSTQQEEDVIDLTVDDDNGTAPMIPQTRKNGRYKLRHGKNGEKVEANNTSSKHETSPNNDTEFGEEKNPDSEEDFEKGMDESECSRFSRTGNEDSQLQSDVLFSDSDKDMKQKPEAETGPSPYELQRLERIKRNIARLESLGFTVKPNTHEKKTTSKPKRRRPSSGSKPSRKYPKRTSNGSVTKAKPVLQTQKKVKLIPFEGEHDDDCYICYDGGELVCCDYCSKAFHPQCHIPPLTAIPGDDWACCECKATQLTRAFRCGECDACTRQDCGKCKYCLDMRRFGGPNIMKQACIHKRCPNKRYAPPTKVDPEKIQQIPSDSIFEGDHSDECYICYDGGELVCCDHCPKAFHLKCHIPPLTEVPQGDWRCCECTATRDQYYKIGQDSVPKGKSRTRQWARNNLNPEEEVAKPPYNQDDYNFLWNYYLHPVKRSKEELPGGMVLRAKSVQCNLLRYSKCQFRQKLFKEIHRLKRDSKNDEIYRMLQMLYTHDVSGAAGDGPEELIEQILKRLGNDGDVEYIDTGEDKEMEVIDVGGESESSHVACSYGNIANAKVKMERNDNVKPNEMEVQVIDLQNSSAESETSHKRRATATTKKGSS